MSSPLTQAAANACSIASRKVHTAYDSDSIMSRSCRSDDNRQDIETRRHILSQVARAASALSYVPNRLAGGSPPRVTDVDFRLIPGANA
jgi:hypothetical protein